MHDRRTENLFRRVVDSALNGMLIIDRKGTILLGSSRMENLFGYDQQVLLGRPIETLIPERYRGQHPGQGQVPEG